MSLITIRTSGVRVDAYLSAIFAMAEAELSKDEIIDSDEYLFNEKSISYWCGCWRGVIHRSQELRL